MRKIKFRAWDIADRKMIYQDNLCHQIFLDGGGLWLAKEVYYGEDIVWERVYGVEFMQYTGLKDKSGKEIYEGDIIKATHEEVDLSGYVRFIDGCFCMDSGLQQYWLMHNLDKKYVVGNIYENPELLESGGQHEDK